MRKIKLGMIGCGLCASTMHVPSLLQLTDQFEVVNVCSRNPQRAVQFAASCNSPSFCTDMDELLADPTVEAVTITYPFEQNHQIVKKALDAGKHVLVEKPMAASLAEAQEMVDWEKETPLVTMIAENFRYRMAMMQAQRYIQEGKIGSPRSILYTCYGNIPRDDMFITKSKWRLTSVGGLMLDRDVHYTAVLRMLCGEAKYAIGYWDKMRDDIGPVDAIALHVVFENGAKGSLHDFASVTNFRRREVVVLGTRGTVVLSEQCTKVSVYNEDGLDMVEKYPTDRADSVTREYQDFYNAIVNGASCRSTFLDGYRDLQLAMTPYLTKDEWANLPMVR